MTIKHILISRTDSIGDVILTLPVAGFLKEQFPDVKLSFLGMPYTRDLIGNCSNIDNYIDWATLKSSNEEEAINTIKNLGIDAVIHVFPVKEIARMFCKAKIPVRIGTTGRIYHWLYCNKLVPLSRKNSGYHEAVLNLMLLKPLIDSGFIKKMKLINPSSIASFYGFISDDDSNTGFSDIFSKENFNLLIHPRSKGSAREWGISNYARVADLMNGKLLPTGKKIRVFITGTREEGDQLREEGFFEQAGSDTIDLTGRFSLVEFIKLIGKADGMIAGSTGPLHIAAALDKIALGLYPPIRPMHPGRWKPIGKNAGFLVADKECSKCRNLNRCECMTLIKPEHVEQKFEAMVLTYNP